MLYPERIGILSFLVDVDKFKLSYTDKDSISNYQEEIAYEL